MLRKHFLPLVTGLFVLMLSLCGPLAAQTELVVVPDVPSTAPIYADKCTDQTCVRLDHGTQDTQLTVFGQCYWLDNTHVSHDYFVPFSTRNEWDQFLAHLPPQAAVDSCCMKQEVQMGVLSDGRVVDALLPLGRSAHPARNSSMAHVEKTYNVNVQSCVTQWDGTRDCNTCPVGETLVLDATCNGGAWNTVTHKTDSATCAPPALYCPPKIPDGTKFWLATGTNTTPGSSDTCHYEQSVESEYLCTSGTAAATGQTRTGDKTLIGTCDKVCTPTTKQVDIGIVIDASTSMDALVAATKTALKNIATTYLVGKPNIRLVVTSVSGILGAHSSSTSTRGSTCQSYTRYGLTGPVDLTALSTAIDPLQTSPGSPIAATIRYTGSLLDSVNRSAAVIVLSDGQENCGGNIVNEVNALKAKGVKMLGIIYNGSGGVSNAAFSTFDSSATAGNDQQVMTALDNYINEAVGCDTPPPEDCTFGCDADGAIGNVYRLNAAISSENPNHYTPCDAYAWCGEDYIPDNICTRPVLANARAATLNVPNQSWTAGFPGVPDLFEGFVVDYHGRINFDVPGTYQLTVCADDAGVLNIDGSLVINMNTIQSFSCKTANVTYAAAGIHNFRLSYSQMPRDHIGLTFFWKKPGGGASVVVPLLSPTGNVSTCEPLNAPSTVPANISGAAAGGR